MRLSHWREYVQLMRLDKPIGIFLLLWPTLWGLWLAAPELPDGLILTVFVLGVILMRSAGCVINDYADRHWDKEVERTQNRPLTSGRVSEKEALSLFMILCLMSFGLVLLLDWKTVLMSLVAVVLAGLYPFMKRHTHWPQVFLGMAFAWAIPMGFMAIQGTVPLLAWVVFAATVVWAVVYDTMYAMVDYEDDLKVGIKSTAVLFGQYCADWVAGFQLLLLGLLVWAGQLAQLGWPYWASLVIVSLFFLKQQKWIRTGHTKAYFDAFLNNHWVGLSVFAGIAIS